MPVCRVERTGDYTTMSNHHLRNEKLSLKAKGLLSLMLSLPETWDYTVKGLAHISLEGIDGITGTIKELEKAGYVERHRIRDSAGRLRTTEYIIREIPIPERPILDNPILAEPVLDKPIQENPAQLSTKELITEKSNTDQSITHSFFHAQGAEGKNVVDERDRIRNQIEYDCMVQRYSRKQLDELVEIMLDVKLNKSDTIRIGKDLEYPREYVQERFSKINALHIEMVMEAISENHAPVHSTKAYLMAVLFNSVSTIDHYYTFQANADRTSPMFSAPPRKKYERNYDFEPGESL